MHYRDRQRAKSGQSGAGVQSHKAAAARRDKRHGGPPDANVLLSALRDAGHPIILIDADGVIQYVNDQFVEWTALVASEVVGKDCSVLRGPTLSTPSFRDIWRAARAGGSWDGDVDMPNRNGGFSAARWVVKAIRSGRGPADVDGFVVTCTDLKPQRQMEEAFERFNAAQSARQLEMEQFVYNVAHNIKTPMVSIEGMARLLAEDVRAGRRSDAEDRLRDIATATAELREMVDDLLDVSRAGHALGAVAPIDMVQVVQTVLKQHRQRIDELGVTVRVDRGMPWIRGDRERMLQVFDNLISNALKYGCGRPAPSISIESCIRLSEVQFAVRDNGPGIPPEAHGRVFQLFERLTSGGEGTGVGLAITKRIVEAHGGRIWVESNPGHGASFRLAFHRSILAEPAQRAAA